MSFNFFIIFFLYFLAIFSVIGYGKVFSYIFLNKKTNFNYGYQGLFGIFFLIIYSYISHFFYRHSIEHNSALLAVGLISYIIFFNKNYKDLIFFISLFFILFISLIILKTHDDFPYYHFGYSWYLIENPIIAGVGMFNHGFRTPSSIFYLNSLFYLPVIKFYFFHLPAIMIVGFTNIIFLNYLFKKIKSNKSDFINYFILCSLILINIFFARIAEHGSDRSAQILILLFLFEIFILLSIDLFDNLNLSKILIFLGIIISLKAFYIFYTILLLPIFIFLNDKYSFKVSFFLFLKNSIFYLFVLLLFLVVGVYFFNTGCLLYPVSFTCFPNFDWSISQLEVSSMNTWYEQWSKAGANPNFRVDNPEEYIAGFNWVGRWTDEYFFNKVRDFLIGIIVTVLVLSSTFFSKKEYKILLFSKYFYLVLILLIFFFLEWATQISIFRYSWFSIIILIIFVSAWLFSNRKYLFVNKYSYIVLILLFIIFLEWFYNHPQLRYGGYSLIAALVFIPFSLFLNSSIKSDSISKKKYMSLIFLIFFLFFVRNVSRINKEIVSYKFKPFADFSLRVKSGDGHYTIPDHIKKLVGNYERCKNNHNNCDKSIEPKVGTILNRYKFIRKDKDD